jgi:hypothetical protein
MVKQMLESCEIGGIYELSSMARRCIIFDPDTNGLPQVPPNWPQELDCRISCRITNDDTVDCPVVKSASLAGRFPVQKGNVGFAQRHQVIICGCQ